MEPISTKNAMRRHPSTSLNKRAPSVLPIKVNSASSCSQLPISWDATQGKAPWTVMIALIDSVPFTFNVPQASGSNFAVNWDVPKLSQNTQALVAVADSTGATSGVSSFINLNAGSGSCSAIQVDLDFVWYPTNNKNTAGHCSDWGISWQTEKSKNSGVEGTVSFTFLPENGQPVTVNAGTGANGAFKFTVPFESGTKFLASANDEGNSGTGGVGDLYSVSNVGQSKSCVALKTVGNGLPKASGTLAPASTSTQVTSKGSTKTSTHGAAASNTSGANSSAVSANESSSDHKSNSTGTAVGATFGVLGALALLGILFWWLRKKQKGKEDEQRAWGGAANNGQAAGANVSPWRYSTSPYEAPQTNSRASAWLRRASGTAATGFRVLSRGANNNSQADMGHGRSGSITTSAQPHMQQATYRNLSVPEDNYALSSIGGANSPDHFPRSPSPTQSQKFGGGGQSIHSTVPDTALFPPPGPRSYGYDEGGYGVARHQRPMQQQQGWQHPSEANSPFADPVHNGSAGAVTMNGYQGPVSEIRKGASSIDSQSNPSVIGRNLIHGRKDGSSAGGSSSSGHGRTVDGLGSEYIGPVGPTKTSIYDPYTHMSQLWDPNNHGEIADRINQAGRGAGQNMQPTAGYHGGFTRNGPGVQRVNAPITSEVMMPEQGMQRFVKTGQRKPTTAEVIDEDREELPYL